MLGRTVAPTSHVHDAADLPAAQRPHIQLSGLRAQQLVSHADIKAGVRLLRDCQATVVLGSGAAERAADALQQLDSCTVAVQPALNPDHETLHIGEGDGDDANPAPERQPQPQPMQHQLLQHRFRPLATAMAAAVDATAGSAGAGRDIQTRATKDGVEMVGYAPAGGYAALLRRIVYVNRKPAYYLNRVFRVVCAQAGGELRSAEQLVTLTVSGAVGLLVFGCKRKCNEPI